MSEAKEPRTLTQIMTDVLDGKKEEAVTYEELRMSLCTLNVLNTIDAQIIAQLAQAEQQGKPIMVLNHHAKHFYARKQAMAYAPIAFLGSANNPDSPEFQQNRKRALEAVNAQQAAANEEKKQETGDRPAENTEH